MEMIIWLSIGALAGGVAAFALPGSRTPGILSRVAVGSAAALAGGLATEAVLGSVARVRVSIFSSQAQAHASLVFGLAPVIGAATAAIVVLVVLGRMKPRRLLASDGVTP